MLHSARQFFDTPNLVGFRGRHPCSLFEEAGFVEEDYMSSLTDVLDDCALSHIKEVLTLSLFAITTCLCHVFQYCLQRFKYQQYSFVVSVNATEQAKILELL
jgi:hypothetical protein